MDKMFDTTIKNSLAPLFEDWDKILKVRDSLDFKFVLPNYFLMLNPEIYIESVVDQVTSKLEEGNLLDFHGPVHSYLYCLTYSPDEDPNFESFRNFYDIFFAKLSHYSEPFRGILGIEITEWVENNACDSKKFLAFMDFMSSIDDSTLALFISRSTNKQKNDEALKNLYSKSRVRPIIIGEISLEDGFNYVMNYLDELNFKVERSAEKPLKDVVKFILDCDGNQGIRSLKQFIDDLVYDSITRTSKVSKTISEDLLKRYGPDSKWAKNFKSVRKNYLGLIGE